MERCKMLLFDLDGTLLRSDKTISQTTVKALQEKENCVIGSNDEDGIAEYLAIINL